MISSLVARGHATGASVESVLIPLVFFASGAAGLIFEVVWSHRCGLVFVDTDRARRAFEASPFIRRLWPEPMATATLPFFDEQRIINRLMAEPASALRGIEELHALLTTTSLRRLPLWALGSNDVIQRIADRGNDGTPFLACHDVTIRRRTVVLRTASGSGLEAPDKELFCDRVHARSLHFVRRSRT